MVLYKCQVRGTGKSQEKTSKKLKKKLLTNFQISDIIITQGQGKVLKTRKGKSMKNTTMNTIYATLSTVDFADKEAIMAELYNDIHRGDAAKEAKAAEYANAREAVLEGLRVAGKPVTLAELWDEVKGSLPNFTKNQVSYGLRNYWADDVAVTVGKVNMYSLKESA